MIKTVIRARNTAPDSPNRIHTEEAKQYGFKGGIVPGLTLYAYMVGPLLEHFGSDWLESGQMETRFRQPVYDGEEITLSVNPTGDDSVSLSITNAEGIDVVTGFAQRRRDMDSIDVSRYKAIPYEGEPLRNGSPEYVATLPDLAEWEMETDAASSAEHLEKIGVDDERFSRVLHPSIVARVSAYIVGRRFDFGPRIHVQVRSRFFASAPVDTPMVGRGRIARSWEHKGNHYLESDLLVVDDKNQPVMQIDSQSLFQLGGSRSNG